MAHATAPAFFLLNEANDGEDIGEVDIEILMNQYRFAIGKALETLDMAVALAVNFGDDGALSAMQTKASEIFRRAAKCRKCGLRIEDYDTADEIK